MKFIPKIVQRQKLSLKIRYVPQNYGSRIFIYIFLAISGNFWQLMKIDIMHPSVVYKSFWDMNLSFFPLFWGYKLHFQPINLRNFNLKKNYYNFEKKTNHRQVDLTLAHRMYIRFTKISQSPSRPSVRAWNTI